VKTNIRSGDAVDSTFSWIDSYSQLRDRKSGTIRGLRVTLAKWFYDGVLMDGGVLSIDPAYFDLTGGRERWLYRVARKHAGGAGPDGFSISMPTLFEKSGAEGEYRRFKFEMIKIVKEDTLPGYGLDLVQRDGGEPLVRMFRRKEPEAPTSKPLPSPTKVKSTSPPSVPAEFPSYGSIRGTPYEDLARGALPTPHRDFDLVAQDFRRWLNAEKISLSNPKLPDIFASFCRKQFA
jgi:plasmid replication initiation protein